MKAPGSFGFIRGHQRGSKFKPLISLGSIEPSVMFLACRLSSGLIEVLFVTFDGRVVAGLVQKIYTCLPVGIGCLTPEGPIDGRP